MTDKLVRRMFVNLKNKKSDDWTRLGKQKSLLLFKKAAKRVPGYKKFLKENRIESSKIKTWENFQKLPTVNKKNYLRKHTLENLCWGGSFKDSKLIFTATSGSTGKPFYFPRSESINWQSSVMHEMFLRNHSQSEEKPTLVVVCFGMGVWIGGLITYAAFRKVALQNYNISIITPGANKREIFDALTHLKDKFERIILCGYPPFIKDVIDEGSEHRIFWKELDLKIVFAAETFSERFRNYITKNTGIKNIYTDMMNIYGTADLGTMAEETPMSILIRRIAIEDNNVFENIFGDAHRLPTLVQFIPSFVNFEEHKGRIVCTGDSTLPLIRYDVGDYGGVISYNEMESRLASAGVNLKDELKKNHLEKTVTELPFVYIYERADLSTKLYGAIIYPEHIRNVMLEKSIQKYCTEKFTLMTKHDLNENQSLEVNIEMKKGIKKIPVHIKRKLLLLIVQNMLEKNAEYKNNHSMMSQKVIPKLIFWRYGYPVLFRTGIKQKWAKK